MSRLLKIIPRAPSSRKIRIVRASQIILVIGLLLLFVNDLLGFVALIVSAMLMLVGKFLPSSDLRV
jgi:hypothetical protein